MILLLFVVSANAMHSDYFMEPRTIILEDGKELYIRGIFTGEIEFIDSNLLIFYNPSYKILIII